MRSRTAVVVALTAALSVAAITLLVLARSEPTERDLVVGASDYPWPAESLRDWVGYADQIAVVQVVSEKQLPLSDEVRETGEGFVARRIEGVIEETLWARPSSSRAPRTVTLKTTDGWWLKDGQLIPYMDVGSHRAEIADRLLVGIFKSSGYGWTLYTSGIPVRRDGIVQRDPGQEGIAASIDGMSLSEVSAALRSTDPDPIVAKYEHLDPVARAQAAWREKAGQQSR